MHTVLIKKVNGQRLAKPRELQKRIATIEDVTFLTEIHKELQANVINHNTGESLFAADNEQFIKKIITSHRGVIQLYYDQDEFVGFWELNVPDNLNCLEEYQLPKGIDFNKVGIYESVAVMPRYRGNGLQYAWGFDFENVAKEKGITTIVGTVHPQNTYSLNNVLKLNYNIKDEVDFHYGRRFIIHKNI